MVPTLAAIGFDPEIRGILVVATGAIMLMGTVWLLLATNSGVRLGTLLALAGFFGWMVIMGAYWWIAGIGYVGESVSWQVRDLNRGDIAASSVERARDLPDPASLQGLGFQLAEEGLAEGVEEMADFTEDLDRSSEDFSGMTDEVWPPQPRPNPFIPLSWQRERGMPRACAEQELQFARSMQDRLIASSDRVVVSAPLPIIAL